MAILLTKNSEVNARLVDVAASDKATETQNCGQKSVSSDTMMSMVRQNDGTAKLNELVGVPAAQYAEPGKVVEGVGVGPDRAPSACSDGMVFPQGPIYTGYPATAMNPVAYMPYSVDGVVYHNQVMEYNPVNSQAFLGNMTVANPYLQSNDGYYSVYPYQMYPIIQYSPPESGGVVLPFVQSPAVGWGNGYLGAIGQNGPEFMPPCEGLTIPVPFAYPPGMLSASAPSWLQQHPDVKGYVKMSSQTGSQPQQPVKSGSIKSVPLKESGMVANESKSSGLTESTKKQYRRVVAAAMLSKSVWPPQGWQYVPVTQPLKAPVISPCYPTAECSLVDINTLDFPIDYKDAKFFIIKSFSEENVVRSIQHGVWASTPNGNEKLNAAFQDAQQRLSGKSRECPVFLFFSVNGSGRFCGLAEMLGPVDYKKTMEFWERNKWTGSFPVRWHIVKDLPNSQLRRIILQSNENKPVTSSRDTQEVNFQQGLEMLSIFKNFFSKNSILDHFPKLVTVPKVVVQSKSQQELSSQCPTTSICEKLEAGMKALQLSSQALKASKSGNKHRDMSQPTKPSANFKAGASVQDLNDKENQSLVSAA